MVKFKPALRDSVPLLIGLAGSTGSGKTLSALKLARGIAGGDDTKIAFIDTESGRAKHYAPAPGESPSADKFGFSHGELSSPFTPEAYLEAIKDAEQAGYSVIVIDSFSHEWAGEGGVKDMHEQILSREAGNDAWKRDKLSIGAWKEPKHRHDRLVSRLTQVRCHLIICMRADEKLRMETVEENGKRKTVIIQPKDLPPSKRWVPICEKRFPYELLTSFLLTADRPGVPIPLKLQAQHREFFPADRPLSEEMGARLAEWARGGKPRQEPDYEALLADAMAVANRGRQALKNWYAALTDAEADAVREHLAGPKKRAQEIDGVGTNA